MCIALRVDLRGSHGKAGSSDTERLIVPDLDKLGGCRATVDNVRAAIGDATFRARLTGARRTCIGRALCTKLARDTALAPFGTAGI